MKTETTKPTLVLIPCDRQPALAHWPDDGAVPIDATRAPVRLAISAEGVLSTQPLQPASESDATVDQQFGVLAAATSSDNRNLHLINPPQCLHVNGKRPFALSELAPGDLLSIGGAQWWVAQLHTPTPVDPPAELVGKLCPACGGDLAMPDVRVVICACGQAYHMENPADLGNKDLLNCYTESVHCGQCHQPCTLAPRLIPVQPSRLFDVPEDDFDQPWNR